MSELAMIYRQNATELHDEHVRAEAHELEVVVSDARARRRSAAIMVGVVLLVASIAPVAYATAGKTAPTLHCHVVHLKYENAPQLPPQSWTACEWR